MSGELGYGEIPHTADLALWIHGATLQSLFEHAGQGLVALAHCEPAPDATTIEYALELDAPDPASLLIDWLNELIYLITDKTCTPSAFEFKALSNTHLEALVIGQSRSAGCRHIKAATYHDLALTMQPDYQVVIVFDV
jgi:SHS2 domain-containing protein